MAGNDHITASTGIYYLIEFCGELGGRTNPLLGIDTSGLTNPDVAKEQKIQWRAGTGGTVVTGGRYQLAFYGGWSARRHDWLDRIQRGRGDCRGGDQRGFAAQGTVECYGGPVGNPATVATSTDLKIRYLKPEHKYGTFTTPGRNLQNWTSDGTNPDLVRFAHVTGHPSYSLSTLVWEHSPGGSASQLTVTDGNVTTRCYDPVSGSDANPGTEARQKRHVLRGCASGARVQCSTRCTGRNTSSSRCHQ